MHEIVDEIVKMCKKDLRIINMQQQKLEVNQVPNTRRNTLTKGVAAASWDTKKTKPQCKFTFGGDREKLILLFAATLGYLLLLPYWNWKKQNKTKIPAPKQNTTQNLCGSCCSIPPMSTRADPPTNLQNLRATIAIARQMDIH